MNIVIASHIDEAAVSSLRAQHNIDEAVGLPEERLADKLRDCDVLVFRSGVRIGKEVLRTATKLRLVVRAGCGVDNVDLEYLRFRGIQLHRIPQPGALAVAELAFALMLSLARRVREADQSLRAGHWAKHEIEGHLLYGSVLGIVGAGNIGSRTGEIGAALGMKVIGCVESPNDNIERVLARKQIRLTTLSEVLSQSDYISIHVPLQGSTRNLIDAAALAKVKTGVIIVNLARGGVVDEQAMLAALLSGKVRGAALDVHEREGEGAISPLAALPNVLLTPHIGAETQETKRQIGERIVEIIRNFADEQSLIESAASA